MIKDSGTAEQVTEARVRADAADGVAAEREAAAVNAKTYLDSLDKDLREAREGLEGAESILRAAAKAAKVPAGVAPISDVTVRFNSAYMQQDPIWNALPGRDRDRVRWAGEPRNMMSDEEFRASMRAMLGQNGTAV